MVCLQKQLRIREIKKAMDGLACKTDMKSITDKAYSFPNSSYSLGSFQYLRSRECFPQVVLRSPIFSEGMLNSLGASVIQPW